jgi:flavin reductase (DIM6/NTAB) family NADH-FMN oxidoreductase RutF
LKVDLLEDKLCESIFLLQPTRPILCSTKNEDGTDHVAPFSWINPVSYKPPRVALALLNSPKKQHSLENIERTGEFVVNIPTLDIADQMVGCSFKTKFGENKFDRSGFERLKSVKVTPPCIAECKAHLECKLYTTVNAGDHTLLVADVVHASYDNEVYSENLLIKLDKFKPAIHVLNYNLENSQIHIFLNPAGSHVTEVFYPKKEK